MVRRRSTRFVVSVSFGLLPVLATETARATDLIVDSTVLYSALDGGPNDDDGLVDGFLTLGSLIIVDGGEIILDLPDAKFHVLGEIRLEGNGTIRPPTDPQPTTGPTLTMLSGGSIVLVGKTSILADGLDLGGAILLCADEDIELRGNSSTIASSGLSPNSVGGSIVMQAGQRIKLNSSPSSIIANGASGGSITLISCGDDVVFDDDAVDDEDLVDAGLAILIKGKLHAIGTDGSGGTVEVVSRQGGIEFRGTKKKLHVDATGTTQDGTITLTAATLVTPDPPSTDPSAVLVPDSPSAESCDCSLFGPLVVTIESPENQSVTADSSTDVSGRVSGAAVVAVNGVEASVVAGTFTALDVPLSEGTNTLVATAQNEAGGTGSDTVSVRRDTQPPLVVIETPGNGDRLVTETVTVAGTVNDIIPGATTNADDVTVTVNGLPAAVNNRTFILPDLPLALGDNTITAIAVDRVGNTKTNSIQVTREPDLAGIQIVITGGNTQRGPINSLLPGPLSVRLQDADGFVFPNRPLTFEVSRGDGRLAEPADNVRLLTLLSDGDGGAVVDFSLGSRTGEGFHRVRVTTPGSLTFAEFCATAESADPVNIAINAMPPGQGVAGQPLPVPLSVILTDFGGNPVEGATVAFTVEFGGGNFDGAETAEGITNADGVAETEWTLGPDPGVGNNEATATFEGNPGFPATFVVSGIVTGAVEDTTVSAIVQDSTGAAIEGVRAVVRNSALEAFTGPDGKFTITDVPPGGHHVGVLGSAADDPENGIFFPDIDFAIEAISGVDNMLDPPVVILPFLDIARAQLVGGDEDVILTMADTAGFSVKVFANSTFKRDPVTGELVQEPLVMSSSQVKFDKLPMPPPQGSTPLIVGTLQPPGVIFDPPARVTYPNIGGLAPGDVADMFAFHHDIGQFVNIGPGTVSEDGSVVVSDPGFGIVQSGWHCLIRIPGPSAKCANGCKATATIDGKKVTPGKPVIVGVGKSKSVTVTFTPAGTITGSWASQNSSIATVAGGSSLSATLTGAGPGATKITSPTSEAPSPDPDKGPIQCQAEIDVSVLAVEQDKALWYFGGEDPSTFTDGAIEVTLTAQGAATGTFKWTVTAGADKVDLENNSDTITKTNSNTVKVRSTKASTALKDVTIALAFNNADVTDHEFEVRAPKRLKPTTNSDSGRGSSCNVSGTVGFRSLIAYEILNQFNELVKNAGINEAFGTETDVITNDWPVPAEGGFAAPSGTFADFMCVTTTAFNPDPQSPQSPLSATVVDEIAQTWFSGSTVAGGAGVHVQSNDFTRFIDHGRHRSITTP